MEKAESLHDSRSMGTSLLIPQQTRQTRLRARLSFSPDPMVCPPGKPHIPKLPLVPKTAALASKQVCKCEPVRDPADPRITRSKWKFRSTDILRNQRRVGKREYQAYLQS